MKEVKIDKRTKAYKDGLDVSGEDSGTTVEKSAGDGEKLSCSPEGEAYFKTLAKLCHKCGGSEDLVEISPQVRLCRSCISGLDEAEPKVNGPNYGLRENNPGFKLCMKCGGDLPPNEDGKVVARKVPMACDECVNRNRNFMMKDGKRVPIEKKKDHVSYPVRPDDV